MLYPAYWLVIAFVGFAVLFWLGMLMWAARTGLFSRDSETLRYKALDSRTEETRSGEE
jgi:threonine/homoserine/homoserine lactone efflux protein